MELWIFIKVLSICLIGAISPGPSWILIISNTVYNGKICGFITSIGHGVGITFYAFFATFGIGLLIKSNIFIFNIIKISSIIFLLYLGIKSFYSNKSQLCKKNAKGKIKSFMEGLSLAIFNPKVFIWFFAIYAQFISIENTIIFKLLLIFTAGIVDIVCYSIIVIIISIGVSKNILNLSTYFSKFSGIALIAIAIYFFLNFLNF